jgi:hypothetical protein
VVLIPEFSAGKHPETIFDKQVQVKETHGIDRKKKLHCARKIFKFPLS